MVPRMALSLPPGPLVSGRALSVAVAAGLGWWALLQPLPARAGSETAESVWNKENALQRARQQVPVGATITGHRCESFGVGFDNTRYRCSVQYTLDPPASAPAPAP